ncbi:MAG: hypothetical protein HKN82_01275 [Akkermansiaceae bacterium]|nr:hypothetical protein [Akkermansiaceae bacterium]NNM29165.1 hypothetical protein [Akkermansiaceae bacterium]
MLRTSFALLVISIGSAVFLSSTAPLSANPPGKRLAGAHSAERRALARSILSSPQISLLEYHVSGNRDQATALHNIEQTANGKPAKCSYYGNAPGGSTKLSITMLRAINQLVREGYSFRITEVAGGSHSSRSRHYAGVAFDIDFLNGRKVKWGHPTYRRFMQRCRELGATETLGPGSSGHSTHVHIAWPRPKL